MIFLYFRVPCVKTQELFLTRVFFVVMLSTYRVFAVISIAAVFQERIHPVHVRVIAYPFEAAARSHQCLTIRQVSFLVSLMAQTACVFLFRLWIFFWKVPNIKEKFI